MPRRYPDYSDAYADWNMVATDGYATMALTMLLFFINIISSLMLGKRTLDDPWDAGATPFGWTLSRPPPSHQFETLPKID